MEVEKKDSSVAHGQTVVCSAQGQQLPTADEVLNREIHTERLGKADGQYA